MSSEIKETAANLQPGLQPAAPSAPDGPADGPSYGRSVPDRLSAPSAPEAPPVPSVAHLVGEPGTLPEVWCKKCEATVKPEGKGRCPRCQTFLRQNFVARRHPVNKLRRHQLLDQFVHDYRPDTQRLLSMCEQYAGVVEQLEVLKPGSQEHRRLVELSQLLGAALEESRLSRKAAAPVVDDLTEDELITRIELLLANVIESRARKTRLD